VEARSERKDKKLGRPHGRGGQTKAVAPNRQARGNAGPSSRTRREASQQIKGQTRVINSY